jgi:hypothetical protein
MIVGRAAYYLKRGSNYRRNGAISGRADANGYISNLNTVAIGSKGCGMSPLVSQQVGPGVRRRCRSNLTRAVYKHSASRGNPMCLLLTNI